MSGIETYEEAVAHLHRVMLHLQDSGELARTREARDKVLERFQPVFSEEHLPTLSQHEFHSFLLKENNQHWSGLHRHSPKMTSDMTTLQTALGLLLHGGEEIQERLSRAVSMVTGMGRAVATAILLVVHPNRYGVWNSTSEGGLKFLDLWPQFERGATMGERYVKINQVLVELASELDVDLWTLDNFWWSVESLYVEEGDIESRPQNVQTFSLERHLQDFLWDNWHDTALGQEWELYVEEGEPDAGYEFPSGVGRIDLLANHRTEPRWLVIELKRRQTSDAAVGQVLRYMGWIKQNLAKPDEEVRGLIIAHEADDDLRYALSIVPDIDLQRYEVQFNLYPVPRDKKH